MGFGVQGLERARHVAISVFSLLCRWPHDGPVWGLVRG